MKITGAFHCKVFENKKLVKEFSGQNLVVNVGKARVAEFLLSGGAQALSRIGFGEGTTAPDPSDTNLQGGIFTKPIISNYHISDTVIQFDWVLGNSEANGLLITEFGLLFNDDQLFARKTGLTVAKNPTITLTGSWEITVN